MYHFFVSFSYVSVSSTFHIGFLTSYYPFYTVKLRPAITIARSKFVSMLNSLRLIDEFSSMLGSVIA